MRSRRDDRMQTTPCAIRSWAEAMFVSGTHEVGAPLPAPRTFPNFARESCVRQLPVLEQCESDGPSRIGFQDIVTGNVTGAGAGPVLFRSVPAHQVLHGELNRDVLKVIVDRRVARVVAERQIEGVPG